MPRRAPPATTARARGGARTRILAATTKTAKTAAAGVLAGAIAAAAPAGAQVAVSRSVLDTGIPFDLPETDRVTVLQRRHPEYDPAGVRAGGFLVFPRVEVSANATDNVFGARSDAVADAFGIVAPRIEAQSQWGRHALSARIGGNFRRYTRYVIKDEDGYDIGVNGRLDIAAASSLRGAVSADRVYIDQFSGDFPQLSAASVPIDRQVASLRGVWSLSRLVLTADANVTRLDFNDTVALDGGTIDQDYLDRRAMRAVGRAEYNVSPVTSLFVQGIYTRHDYATRDATFDRTGDEIRVIGGAAFDVTPLIRTRIGLGYLNRSYEQPGVRALAGLALDAQVDYLFTTLTTISVAARRDVRDAILPDSPGYSATRLAAEIDHELLRNLILIVRADVERDDFARIDRDDHLFHIGLSANYLLNRAIAITPTFDYSDRNSMGTRGGLTFNEVRAGIRLTLRR